MLLRNKLLIIPMSKTDTVMSYLAKVKLGNESTLSWFYMSVIWRSGMPYQPVPTLKHNETILIDIKKLSKTTKSSKPNG
jgi:hypothetical protein